MTEPVSRRWPGWFVPRLPDKTECSPGLRLVELAEQDPDAVLLVHSDGRYETREKVLEDALSLAGRLHGLGIRAGEPLLAWLPTGPEMVRTIFAASLLGLVLVPLNTSMRGGILAHMIALAGAETLICHPALLERLEGLELSGVRRVILLGGASGTLGRCTVLSEAEIPRSAFQPVVNRPWDIAAIIFSSGTTGAPKGVRVPAAQLWSLSQAFYGHMQLTDRMLLMYPLFHIAGYSAFYSVMSKGASMAVTEAFSATDFWPLLQRTGSTVVPGLGPTFLSVLDKPEPRPTDRENSLRMVNVQTISPEAKRFAARFGCSIVACYGMSEASGICVSAVDEQKEGIVGRPRDGLEVRVVDEHDVEVPCGTPGELVVRASIPWTLNDGYHGDDRATRAAWRNGWFHTGDLVRQDQDGDISFVDRKKDIIRRRSENISSSEVESVLRKFPSVQDVAAIGVDFEGDQEILAVLTAVPGQDIDLLALTEFLVPRMPHFMVPRFFRILASLPKTHTDRVRKEELGATTIIGDCWDREAAGLRLRGQRLS